MGESVPVFTYKVRRYSAILSSGSGGLSELTCDDLLQGISAAK